MLEIIHAFRCPPDDTVVWRFMRYTHFARLLQTSQLHFTQITKFKDRYEGTLPPLSLQAQRENMREQLDKMNMLHKLDRNIGRFKDVIQYVRSCLYASCWHKNKHESAAMWDLYTHGDDGIAVKCTVADLKAAFASSSLRIYPADVVYIDHEAEATPHGNLLSLAAYKRKSFEHEAEFRLLHWTPDAQQQLMRGNTTVRPPSVIFGDVDLTILLKHVFVSPLSPGWFKDLVATTLTQAGFSCPCTQSNLYSDPL